VAADLTSILELAAFGIGVHHAGLETEDRKSIERLYLDKTLRVLVATSVCRGLTSDRWLC